MYTLYNTMLRYKNQLVTSRAEISLLTTRTNYNNKDLFKQTQLVHRILGIAAYITSETILFTDFVQRPE